MTKINNFYNIICMNYHWLESKLVKRTTEKEILNVQTEKSIWVLKENFIC